MRLYIDLETYSSVALDKPGKPGAGAYRYSEAPDFMVLMAAYAHGDAPTRVTTDPDEIRRLVREGMADPGTVLTAHNAQFDRVCLSRHVGMPTGRYLDPARWHDTMAVAAELGRPKSLDALARSLGCTPKDSAGTALITFFCAPNRKGERNLPEDHPEKWQQFMDYCRQDVDTLREVDLALGDWPTEIERRVWIADQEINDTGIKVDTDLVEAAIAAGAENAEAAGAEITRLTGVDNPRSLPQLSGWLTSQGVRLPNMRAESVTAALADPSLGDVPRRVLELRQELALVASKKFAAAKLSVSDDGRLRGGFRFFGAHTGRWSGRGVQLHNLTRAGFKSNLPPEAPELLHTRRAEALADAAIVDLKLGHGADPKTLKALVRPMFVGPFTVVDYSAIEARVIAWLSGEDWALEAFRAGRDIYVETAGRMSTAERVYGRSEGKVAVLALGYNGGVNSLRNMGADGTDEELQGIVTQWRAANASIVALWATMERAFRLGGPVGDLLTIEKDDKSRYMRLPSGRAIAYHGVQVRMTETPWGPRPVASFRDPRTGVQTGTYGGRLIENATQAVARDVLAEALVRLRHCGYRIAGHVHDEVLVDSAAPGSLQAVRSIMTTPPAWAGGLPINAEGFTCLRYRKG